jgi:hypothetical protein
LKFAIEGYQLSNSFISSRSERRDREEREEQGSQPILRERFADLLVERPDVRKTRRESVLTVR